MNKRMVALCSILCLCSLFLVGQILAGGTYNNRENTEHAPISIDYKSGDTDWAIEVKDGDGVAGTRTWGVSSDGVMLAGEGKKILAATLNHNTTSALAGSTTGSTGYVITERDFQSSGILMIDCLVNGDASVAPSSGGAGVSGYGPQDQVGVTVYLPTVTESMDGMRLKFVKSSSGATDMFLFIDSLTGNISGATPMNWNPSGRQTNLTSCTDFLTADAMGDYIEVMADYNSRVSYWVIDSYIH